MQYKYTFMRRRFSLSLRLQSRKKESILQLEKHVDKKVHVKFQGGREGKPAADMRKFEMFS